MSSHESASSSEISVVIVNWNTAHLLDACMDSIESELAGFDHEIIVVDNGSSDGSIELLRDSYPHVVVIPLETNVGYQAACNRGAWKARGEIMLHINSDARLTTGSLKALVDVLETVPDIGIVGPRLVYGDGTFQRWTAGRLPTLASMAHSFLLADRFPGRGVWIHDDDAEPGPTGWVSSACLVVRAEVFRAVDGLDERFFAYMDDVDLCGRALANGWRTWYEPSATVIHLMGGSQGRSVAVSPIAINSIVQWFRLRRGRVVAGLSALIMSLGFALRAIAHLGRRDRVTARAHWHNARISLTSGLAAATKRSTAHIKGVPS